MWIKLLTFVCVAIATILAVPLNEEQIFGNFTDVDFYVNPIQARVINGQQAQRRQLPWHAIIQINRNAGSRLCAGSLISSHFVLTEANALRNGVSYDVILGAHHRDDRNVVRRSNIAILHPKHVEGSGNFNIGILQLQRAFTEFTKYIHPVQLANNANYVNRFLWVSGFGNIIAEQFAFNQWATVRVLPTEDCLQTFPGILDHALCSVGHDGFHAGPGRGDGGAPLVALERGLYVQVGVFAFSWRNDFTRPAGYINVTNSDIREWIRTVTSI